MLGRLIRSIRNSSPEVRELEFFDQGTFYSAFARDMKRCQKELIIECPFITIRRVETLLPLFQKLTRRGVRIFINTRDPREHDGHLRMQAETAIETLQHIGAQVLLTGGHHRKLVVLDRRVVFIGSLNVLSQCNSCEIMERIESSYAAKRMIQFLSLVEFMR